MEYKRKLDILVAKFIYKEKIYAPLESYGNKIDYVAANKKSKANEAIYQMDMIDGYILKNFSNNIEYSFELISLINDQKFTVDFSQERSKWKGSIENKNKKIKISECEDINDLICLLSLKAYGFNIENFRNFKFKIKESQK